MNNVVLLKFSNYTVLIKQIICVVFPGPIDVLWTFQNTNLTCDRHAGIDMPFIQHCFYVSKQNQTCIDIAQIFNIDVVAGIIIENPSRFIVSASSSLAAQHSVAT